MSARGMNRAMFPPHPQSIRQHTSVDRETQTKTDTVYFVPHFRALQFQGSYCLRGVFFLFLGHLLNRCLFIVINLLFVPSFPWQNSVIPSITGLWHASIELYIVSRWRSPTFECSCASLTLLSILQREAPCTAYTLSGVFTPVPEFLFDVNTFEIVSRMRRSDGIFTGFL